MVPEALRAFSERVHAVPDDAWARPTPCDRWSVRDLVNHLTAEHLWAHDLLRGSTVEQVGDDYDGDVLGPDPVAAWDRAAERSGEAWRAAAPDGTVNLSSGDAPVERYAEEMLLDLTVHAWDLARGAGLDERLPEQAVTHCLAYARRHAGDYVGSGLFAAPVPTDSADPQVQLLALLGRGA